MGYPWIKIWVEWLDDVKMSSLSEIDQLRFVKLIVLAGVCDAAGALVVGDKPMTIEQVAWKMHQDGQIDSWSATIDTLIDAGLLKYERGLLVVTNFVSRQGPSQADKRQLWREQQHRRRARAEQEPATQENATPIVRRKHTRGVSAVSARSQAGVRVKDKEEDKEEDIEKTRSSAAPGLAETAWSKALSQMKYDMPKAAFDKWVDGCTVESWDGDRFVVRVANEYARGWMTSRMTSTASRLLTGLLNTPVEHVEFVS